jgi:diaminopimelate epimerase
MQEVMGSTKRTVKVSFTKMAGTGNDFIMVNNVKKRYNLDWQAFAVRFCPLKTGIGADGVIVLDEDTDTDFTFRIFNADGSEAEMCGNGARCAALFAVQQGIAKNSMRFKTLAGIIGAGIDKEDVAIRMTDPEGLKTNISINVEDKQRSVHFINTGVPHIILFTDHIEDARVFELGRAIRFHNRFAPAGTNANFVQVLSQDRIHVRTYERGVEAETYACGTGAVASAIIAEHLGKVIGAPVHVHTKGGDLKIDFTRDGSRYSGVWLIGPVDTVFSGEVLVRS